MTLVKSRAELIDNHTSRGLVEEHVDIILKAAERLTTVSKKAYRATEVLQSVEEPEEVNIANSIEDSVADIQTRYPNAAISTEIRDRPTASANQYIGVAFRELIENSIVHNTETSPNVSVSVRNGSEDIFVEIHDDGPGIEDSELAVLDRTEETSLEHGSGVGLWLAAWVIETTGGSIDFDTTPDGTTARIQFRCLSHGPRSSGA
jgi:signal transduction histidine kinase